MKTRTLFLLAFVVLPAVGTWGVLWITSPEKTARLPASIAALKEQMTSSAPSVPSVLTEKEYAFFQGGVPEITVPTDLLSESVDGHGAMGIYLTPNLMDNPETMAKFFDAIKASGGNAFVVAVKGGQVFFPSNSPLANKFGLVHPNGDLKAVIAEAKSRGIYTIARFIALKDPNLAAIEPSTQVKDPETGQGLGEMWVDGSNEIVLQYNKEVLIDLLATGIDEVNLDYIRFPTEYPAVLRSMNTEQKVEKIEPFVKMARETIDQYSPSTKLGLSTYAILGWNYPINLAALGQDVVKFAPYIDIISPMAYPSTFTSPEYYIAGKHPGSRDYYLVWRTLEGYKKLLGEDGLRKLRPWIQGYYVDQQDVIDQIKAVHDAGLCGFTVWNAQNNYDPVFGAMKRMPAAPVECHTS